MSRDQVRQMVGVVALLLGCATAGAMEPRLPPPYWYTVGKLYTDFVAADRARWLANQIKGGYGVAGRGGSLSVGMGIRSRRLGFAQRQAVLRAARI